jgi:hypothetical protein
MSQVYLFLFFYVSFDRHQMLHAFPKKPSNILLRVSTAYKCFISCASSPQNALFHADVASRWFTPCI